MKSFKPQKPRFRTNKQKIFENIIKTGQFIHHIGELEALRLPSEPVLLSEIPSGNFREKLRYLKSCLRTYRTITGMGRGIAGVQVGIPERIAVIWMPHVKGKILTLINPVITKKSEKFFSYPEVCMSATPLVANVVRPSWVEFEYYDENAEKKTWMTKDTTHEERLYNRIFQHEIDHVDGIINIDRVESKSILFELDPLFYEQAQFKEVISKD